ncbi:glutathione peroxidase [Halalkalibacillus sediminis]|uniref:Glutathione peroxidase n=1 Tax=Halalkalibacillus sediminis TaxID=2018042 RepID=A0A2I0QVW7_9BACI|nr:glutathione peroxidase [Halalkalibacillus sediminis]PKR78439.1 glutathione peroxidase [Halalkalibacillus sediminis]
MQKIHDFEVKKSNGEYESLQVYDGKVLLIVNTASKCGFTPQFEGLQKLYDEYRDQGFYVLGFPCDQFMKQEYDDQEEIMEYCQTNYGVDFPMYHKVDVKGDNQEPLFKHLTQVKKGFLGGEIKWNFTKFLIDRGGNVLRRYAPQSTPEKIEADIQNTINQKANPYN